MYRGIIPTITGKTFTVEIDDGIAEVHELRHPADEPLVVEWSDMSKQETVFGSMATLKVLSPADRSYIGLYTTKAGSVVLRIYEDGVLWWMGTLDTEFYEEPYSSTEDYEVSLSFSDFGILDRMTYSLTGIVTLQDIVTMALEQCNLANLPTRFFGSSTHTDGTTATLDTICVRSDNFTDESGDKKSSRDVVEGVFLPLGLKMRQWKGELCVYDLNGLYSDSPDNAVRWAASDQVLGVDSVANSVVITFSPYADNNLTPKEDEFVPFAVDPDLTNLTTTAKTDPTAGSTYHTYYIDYSGDVENFDYGRLGFTFHYTTQRSLPDYIALISANVRNFRIVSHSSGDDAQGLALLAYTNVHGSTGGDLTRFLPGLNLESAFTSSYDVLMQMRRVYVTGQDQLAVTHYIRLTMEMMMDGRYNPFEESDDDNDGGRNEYYNCRAGYVLLPFTARIYDAAEGGNALYHYDNVTPMASNDIRPTFGYSKGRWEEGAGSVGKAYLAWYSTSDRAEQSGTQGFSGNRQYIGLTTRDLYESFASLDDGQYIQLPPAGGWLEIVVYRNVEIWDFDNKTAARTDELKQYLRWWLVCWPKLDIIQRGATMHEPDKEDIIYTGTLDADARDPIELDTICGTSAKSMPTARGLYLRNDGTPLASLTRAGRTDSPEQLLIGTLHSQYATRHTTLTGTLHTTHIGRSLTYRDASMSDVRLTPTAETWDIQADEAEMTLVELTPDIYDKQQ